MPNRNMRPNERRGGDPELNDPTDRVALMRPRLPAAPALRPYLEEIDRNRWYSNHGPLERRLVARLAGHFGLPEGGVTSAANGTVALTLALMAATGGSSETCLVPAFTFVATAHAVRLAGLTPRFVDVAEAGWTLTPDLARAALTRADRPVAAVLPVGAFGAPVDAAAWDAFTRETGVPVVIDAAAGFDGARIGDCPTVISLHATKPMPAGEGAIVASLDPAIVAEIMARANFGFRGRRHAEAAGGNGKMSEYTAAVAHASFDRWPEIRAGLAQAADRYRDGLAEAAGVACSPGFGDGWVSSTCNITLARPDADQAIVQLGEAGIEARQWWGRGCHRDAAFADCACDRLPVTDALARRVIGVPFYADMPAASVERVCRAVAAIAGG